jgi:hypothetical protein
MNRAGADEFITAWPQFYVLRRHQMTGITQLEVGEGSLWDHTVRGLKSVWKRLLAAAILQTSFAQGDGKFQILSG